jgi:DNA processing protein
LEYWIWLSAAAVSPKGKTALLEQFGDPEAAFFAPKGAFSQIEGLSKTEAERLEQRDLSQVPGILEQCRRQDLRILTFQDAAYPRRLRNIYAPPVVLYQKGTLPEVDREVLISVIGTRKASVYGLRTGRELAWQICRCGGSVVSLLTTGVDAEAARGALLADGRCIGVLGTAHEELRSSLGKELAARGALLSEYPPGTRSQKSFFRDRNRIAAGLSVGVVVVEAPEHSGTRLFAQEALEQGKEVFAVPGNVNAENSAGTLAMLKEGARLATCGWDVLEDFQSLFPGRLHDAGREPPPGDGKLPAAPAAHDDPEPEPEKPVDKKPEAVYIDLREQLSGLPEEQLAILTAIEKESSHVDDIILRTGLPTGTVLRHLTMLTIKGYVKRNPGNFFQLNITKK